MAISKYLDPKNDVAFRKIFGTEKNKDILIHFLNDVLLFSENSIIIDIEFLSPIQDPEISIKKQSIVDILCRDKRGIQFIVEMQVARSKGFEKRAQYYASKAYGRQANIGDKYYNLKEIIFLAIADCEIFPSKSHYKSDHIILDKETYEHDLKDFYFTFIELPKFNKTKEELSSIEDKWYYFLKHAHETTESDLKKIIGCDDIISRAYSELDQFHWTEQELLAYEEIKRINMDNIAVMEQKIDEAEARGEARGEENKAIKIAKEMLVDNEPVEKIIKYTKLTKKQLEKLKSIK